MGRTVAVGVSASGPGWNTARSTWPAGVSVAVDVMPGDVGGGGAGAVGAGYHGEAECGANMKEPRPTPHNAFGKLGRHP